MRFVNAYLFKIRKISIILFFENLLKFRVIYDIIIFVMKRNDEVCLVLHTTAERVATAESDPWEKRRRFASERTG